MQEIHARHYKPGLQYGVLSKGNCVDGIDDGQPDTCPIQIFPYIVKEGQNSYGILTLGKKGPSPGV